MKTIKQPRGLLAFSFLAIGQAVSLTGSAMSLFALTIWAWEKTGSATALAMVGFFGFAPVVVFGPVAGALVDRWNRKLVMMLSDLGAGISTIAILILSSLGYLEIWHLYIAAAFSGIFQSFQFPAYSASASLMLPKEHLERGNSMMALAEAGSGIFAPALAGALIGTIGLKGILLIDVVTFSAAIGALILIYVPQPPRTETGKQGQGSLWKESLFGFKYILERPSLLYLQIVFMLGNFFWLIGDTLLNPFILSRTGDNATILGIVQSAAAIGGVLGSLALTIFGGFKRRVTGVLLGWSVSGVFMALLGAGKGLIMWMIGNFGIMVIASVINASNQAIWQSKVAPDVQGRVFSVRRLVAVVISPLAMLLAGPLADKLFEPAFINGAGWTSIFSGWMGTGKGAGMGLIIVVCGILTIAVSAGAYLNPLVRNVETILPDIQVDEKVVVEPVPVS